MAQHFETNCRPDIAAGALTQYVRVKTPGALAVAGISDIDIGTVEQPAFAAGDVVPVRLRTAAGTCKMVAAAAITANAVVYTAASGKISSASTGAVAIGIALTAASADGDIVEVLRYTSPIS